MSTMYTLPEHLFTGDAREALVEGMQNAGGSACPDVLHRAMGEEDLRWDQLVDRAIERALPDVAALLDAAIAAEWERTPIKVGWQRVPKALEGANA